MSSSRKLVAAAIALVGVIGLGALWAHRLAGRAGRKTELVVYVATSLAPTARALADRFERARGDVDVRIEVGGSRLLARRIADLHSRCDLVALADADLLERDLVAGGHARGYLHFCGERLGIVYADGSAHADELAGAPWYDVLCREGVRVGRADPDTAPAGYRTLLLFQLAEAHYGVPGLEARLAAACPDAYVRPSLAVLAALVKRGELDYSFDYRSGAVQYGLRFHELPAEIDFSDPAHAEAYARAGIDLAGASPGERVRVAGRPIRYAAALPVRSTQPELAAAFLAILVGPEGRAELAKNGLAPLARPIAHGDAPALPPEPGERGVP